MSASPAVFAESMLHVDMDAFFVEVERLDDPSLRGNVVVVGGDGPRGVVASASYEARAYGIRSAMPMGQARRRFPSLVVVPPSHGKYSAVSERVFAIFRSYTPLVEGLSVDEAFLDVSGSRLLYASPHEIAAAIRADIRIDLGLPASVGIASTKFVAKLASSHAKPDGVTHIPAGRETEFLHPLPVQELWGVGAATHASLEQLGVATIGDLAAIPTDTLVRRLGAAVGTHLAQLSHGIDPRPVEPDGRAKSISVEHTYDTDITGYDVLEAEVLRHAERVGTRLRRAGVSGRTVGLKVRFEDFTTTTRSHTLPSPTDVSRDIYQAARQLLRTLDIGDRPVRLLGVGVSGLVDEVGARQLAVDRPAKWDELADAVDDVRRRYGSDSVAPARVHARDDMRDARGSASDRDQNRADGGSALF